MSRPAAHSSAEPWAISKNRQRSFGVYLPLPSAILSGIEVDARVQLVFDLTDSQRSFQERRKPSNESDRCSIDFQLFMIEPAFLRCVHQTLLFIFIVLF